MRQLNLRSRIEKLENKAKNKPDTDFWDRTYDFLLAAQNLGMEPPPGVTQEQIVNEFIARNGTKQEYISRKGIVVYGH